MMESLVVITAALLFGAFIGLAICLYFVFFSHQKHVDRTLNECVSLSIKLQEKIDEFKEIGEKASAANQSWAQAMIDFDLKIKEIENRIAMVKMQR